MRAWGIDVSGWNNPPPNYELLVENGATFAVIKGSMGGGISTIAEKQAYDIRNARFPIVGIYHWADPIHRNPNEQLSHIRRIVNIIKPDFIAIDNEQWWASWNAFYQFRRGEISFSAVPKLSPSHISQFGYELLKRTQEEFGLPVLNYTARWFIESHARPIANWINEFPLWFAEYVSVGEPEWTNWKIFNANINELKPGHLPPNAKYWHVWQITDRKRLPKFPARYLDINIFNGSYEDMNAWLNKTGNEDKPVPPIIVQPYYETYINQAILGMIVRDFPNGKDTKERIKFQQTFYVFEKMYHPPHWWGKISPDENKWVALTWSKRVE